MGYGLWVMGYGADLRLSAAVSRFSTFPISSFPPPALTDSAPSVLFVAARALEVKGQRLWVMGYGLWGRSPVFGCRFPIFHFLNFFFSAACLSRFCAFCAFCGKSGSDSLCV